MDVVSNDVSATPEPGEARDASREPGDAQSGAEPGEAVGAAPEPGEADPSRAGPGDAPRNAHGVNPNDRAAAVAGAGRGKRSMRNMAISLAAILVPTVLLLGLFALLGGNGLLGNSSGNTVEPGSAYDDAGSVMDVHRLSPVPHGWRILNAAAQQQGSTLELQLGLDGPSGAQARIIEVPRSAAGLLAEQISGVAPRSAAAQNPADPSNDTGNPGSGSPATGPTGTTGGHASSGATAPAGSGRSGPPHQSALPEGRQLQLAGRPWTLVPARAGQQALYSLRPKVALLVVGVGGVSALRPLATTLK